MNPENVRPYPRNSRHNTNPFSHTSRENETSSSAPSPPVHWRSLSFTTQFSTFIDTNPQQS